MLLPRKMLSQVGVEGRKSRMGGVGQDCVLVLPTVGRSRDTGTPVEEFETHTSCEELGGTQPGDLGSRYLF